MKNTERKKISRSTHAIWSALYWATLLFSQLIMAYMNTHLSDPLYLGPLYVPLLIDLAVLILIIVAFIVYRKKEKQSEKNDELSALNEYKAGLITKYILVFVFAAFVLTIQDFSVFYTDDILGNIMRTFLIFLSITEIIHNIVFIILEKIDLE